MEEKEEKEADSIVLLKGKWQNSKGQGTYYRVGKMGVNRERVSELRIAHPDWTLQKIADGVGITKERVRQLLVLQGLPTRHV